MADQNITMLMTWPSSISSTILSSSGSGIIVISGGASTMMLAQGEAGITVIQTPAPIAEPASTNPAFDEAFQ